MAQGSATISPTAHYTGYTWYRGGLSHPALVTNEGRILYTALEPLQALARVAGAPTLQGFLLPRHRALDHLLRRAIDEGKVTQVIEVAAGLSPRGWRFKQRYGKKLRYIEADLAGMATRKQDLLTKSGLQSQGHEVVTLDALADAGPFSLAALSETLDATQGLAIITEGLLNYFDSASVTSMWARFAQTLSKFPHGLYFSDLHLENFRQNLMTRGFLTMLSAFVRGRVHLHFRNSEQACTALRQAGFVHAELHSPREFASELDPALLPGANLVRIIEASCGSRA